MSACIVRDFHPFAVEDHPRLGLITCELLDRLASGWLLSASYALALRSTS
jgi:hypothetical protein